MIQNDQELKATLNRIKRFQKQVEKLQQVETNPRNYELSAGVSCRNRSDEFRSERISVNPSEQIDRTNC